MGGTTGARPGPSRWQRARLRYGWGFERNDFVFYDVNRPGHDATDYLGYHWYRHKIRPVMNNKWARSVTEDKWIFYRLADSFGWPAPRTVGLYDGTYGTSWDLARPLRTIPDLLAELHRQRPDGLVLKPNGGHEGLGVHVLRSIDHDTGRAVTGTGEVTTLERALRGLDLASGDGGYPGYIVQELVRNHPLLDELAPYATNSLRVQTILTDDGEGHILGAVLRLARSGQMVDNFAGGGVAVNIDRETGITGRGLSWESRSPVLTHHPDTGKALVGRQLPFWDEVVELVCQGARRLTGLHGIGWDIALSPTGPVILEANNNWGMQLLQAHTDGYLADPEFRTWMAGIGAPLPTGNLLRGLVGRRLWPVAARLKP